MHEVEGIWLKNDGRSLRPVPGPKKQLSSILNKSPLSFDDMRVKKFDENGLYNAEELKKSHALFFEAHDIKLVNEDVGQGILHGRNTYSYDFAPVSSPKAFFTGLKKLVSNYLAHSHSSQKDLVISSWSSFS